MVVVTPSGHVWLLTRSGSAVLVDENGRTLASKPQALPWAGGARPDAFDKFSPILSGPEDIVLWTWDTMEAAHVRLTHGSIQVNQVLEGRQVTALDVDPAGEGLWAQSNEDGNLYFVSLGAERYLEQRFVMKASSETYVYPAGDGLHGWIEAPPASFAYVSLSDARAALKLKSGSLEINNGRDITIQGRLELQASLRANEASSIELQWSGSSPATGVLEFSLWDEGHPSRLVASGTRQYGPGAPPPHLQWHLDELFTRGGYYRVVFSYHDQTGIDTSLVVRHLHFSAPLWEQVWFRTSIACLVATLLFGLPLVLMPRSRSARSWLPFIGWSLQLLAGSGLSLTHMARSLKIDFPVFAGVLLAEAILALLLGVLSPPVFRLLAEIKPFQWISPLALALPRMRRRLFADYVTLTWRKVESQRLQANHERYVSLPADLQEGGACLGPSKPFALLSSSNPVALPETHLCHTLSISDPDLRGNVLIESPGGRGKSALLRETVQRMILLFEKDPLGPLPVLCDTSNGTLLEAARRALEVDPLMEALREAMLLRGDYVLVVDGLTESSLSPDEVRGFIEGKHGRAVKLLCTSRPHDGFRQAIEGSSCWLHVQPRRLDEQTLDWFVSAYCAEGESGLGDDLREACRGPDGTYLPILVRLAILFGNFSEHGRARSISALYDAAFRSLLRKQGTSTSEAEDREILAWTSAFCCRTYWADGVRALRYRNSPEREQLERLLRAGVLIPDEPHMEQTHAPRQVRFFHDSMQSYLTACGLFAQAHGQPTWEVLWRAAGDPLFTSAQSELASGGGSELFQMCLQVFGPEERLRKELQRQILEWARVYDDTLTKRDIIDQVPSELRSRLHQALQDSSVRSPGEVLSIAARVCVEAEAPLLGAFYMRIASRVWPLAHPDLARQKLYR